MFRSLYTSINIVVFDVHTHLPIYLDIGVLGYSGIVQHKEHSPEVLHIPPGTPCIDSS